MFLEVVDEACLFFFFSFFHRFHSLAWGKSGPSNMGLIAGGLTNGVVSVWDPATVLAGEGAQPLASAAQHAGPVQGLDWNPSMTHLLASGGSDGQLFIWDMTKVAEGNPSVYVPAPRVKPVQDGMTAVAWNRAASVPHILASALTGGACEIWDLKNKKQVITFHDSRRCQRSGQRSLAWHPTEPTMIVQACDDDASPVVLVWDLKHYAAPVAVLSAHKKGVTSVAWSQEDPSLVISTSRDGHSFVWDVTQSRVRSALADPAPVGTPSTDSPCHTQVAFAPGIRAHLATASSDGLVRVHSLVDPGPRGRANNAQLGAAPGWLKRPCGVSFGFGGRLLRFNAASKSVKIGAVVTDQELVDEARKLQEDTASVDSLKQLCEDRAASVGADEQKMWTLLASSLRGEDRGSSFLTAIDRTAEPAPQLEEKADGDFLADVVGPQSLWGSDDWEAQVGRRVCAGDVSGAWKTCAAAGQWATALLIAQELGGATEWAACRAAWKKSGKAPRIVAGAVSVLAKNPQDLVASGPLDEWKSLAASAVAWGGDKKLFLLSQLGNRLKDAQDWSSAQLCFIAAGDFNGLAGVWTSQHQALSESVRRLLCASRAFGIKAAPHGSSLAYLLSVLADSLASQGDMEGALYWLKQIESPETAPANISLLYQRLVHAKAPKAAPAAANTGVRPAAPATASRTPLYVPTQTPTYQVPAPAAFSSPVAPTFASPVASVPVVQPPAFVQPAVPAFVQPVAPVPFAAAVPAPATYVAPAAVPVVPVTPVAPAFLTPVVPGPVGGAASPAPAAVVAPVANPAIAAACERLSNAANALAGANDQTAKLSDEVVKRVPAVKAKLDTVAAAQLQPLLTLLDTLSEAMESRDVAKATQVYNDAQQHYHTQLGSTAILCLKRCLDLLKKL